MDPLVSVNLTTFNRAHLLPRSLCSVMSQSYNNVEIIIVDDCSIDNTEEVVESFIRQNSKIKFFRHEINKGLSYARNTAWNNSKGEYIVFMDDDDEWIDIEKIEKQVRLFQNCEKNIAIVCSSVVLVAEDGTRHEKIIERPKNLIERILIGNGIIYSPTVMTRRVILEEVGGFDVKFQRGVDSDFYRMCIVIHGYDVLFMPAITTAIHEYGCDRITQQNSRIRLYISLLSNMCILRKYVTSYLYFPRSLFLRLKHSIGIIYKMIIV